SREEKASEEKQVIELFKFLNSLIKLSDRKTLSDKILHEVVTDFNNTIIEKLKLDRIGITLSFDVIDISGEHHKTDDIIAKTEEIITDIKELNLIILAIVTDSEIFKVSPEFKTTSTYALKIVAYFKNANNKYFIGQLRTIQKEIYGKYIQPMIPGDTQ
ncbi:9213_t:CDS:2, partial [Diversispora eburnea]